jgi:hypothetical protein
MRVARRLLLGLLLGALGFGVLTWIALEGKDVANLRSMSSGGAWRATHVWVAEEGGALWVEAATPQRPWLRDVEANPRVEIDRAGVTTRWRASSVPGAEPHDRVRSMLREKYGWADRWVALLQDTSQGVAVRLDPASEAER